MEEFQLRLKNETESLAIKLNKLNDFMRSQLFYKLTRVEKSLLYEQYHAMLNYLEVLGKRLEINGVDFDIWNKGE
jgi:hypothetical protein